MTHYPEWRRYYFILMPLLAFVVPILLLHAAQGSWLIALLISNVRYFLSLHYAWLVNSASHYWGDKPFDKLDILTFFTIHVITPLPYAEPSSRPITNCWPSWRSARAGTIITTSFPGTTKRPSWATMRWISPPASSISSPGWGGRTTWKSCPIRWYASGHCAPATAHGTRDSDPNRSRNRRRQIAMEMWRWWTWTMRTCCGVGTTKIYRIRRSSLWRFEINMSRF